jgi:hypothetical protein
MTKAMLLFALTLCTGAEPTLVAVARENVLMLGLRRASQRRAAVLKAQRRLPKVIARADGGWKGSTLSGYLTCSDAVYAKNFRVTRGTFDVLLKQLQDGGYCLDNAHKMTPMAKRQTGRFKLAVALYFFAQGTGWKAAADCASLGESTVKKYVEEFIDGTFVALRPIYMPRTWATHATLPGEPQGDPQRVRRAPRRPECCDGD